MKRVRRIPLLFILFLCIYNITMYLIHDKSVSKESLTPCYRQKGYPNCEYDENGVIIQGCENRTSKLSVQEVREQIKNGSNIKVILGCGQNKDYRREHTDGTLRIISHFDHSGYLTIDLDKAAYPDICREVTEALKLLPNGSCKEILSEYLCRDAFTKDYYKVLNMKLSPEGRYILFGIPDSIKINEIEYPIFLNSAQNVHIIYTYPEMIDSVNRLGAENYSQWGDIYKELGNRKDIFWKDSRVKGIPLKYRLLEFLYDYNLRLCIKIINFFRDTEFSETVENRSRELLREYFLQRGLCIEEIILNKQGEIDQIILRKDFLFY